MRQKQQGNSIEMKAFFYNIGNIYKLLFMMRERERT